MPRKAALIAEDSAESLPDSPLRRSTRTRVASSPAREVSTVGRTRRNSTSSVDSDASLASAASLPVPAKAGVRTRRPSLTLESNLEKIGEEKELGESLTPVKKTRRGSISSLQDDASTNRAGSPAVASVSERRRTLRSASRSPTSEAKTSSETVTTNGTPTKVRGRRASVEKVPPKRRGSVALEPLDEEGEIVESPKKIVTLKSVNEDVEVVDENTETRKKIRLSSDSSWIQAEDTKARKIVVEVVDENTEAKKKIRLSSDSSWIQDEDGKVDALNTQENQTSTEEQNTTLLSSETKQAKETKNRLSSDHKAATREADIPAELPALKQIVDQFMSNPKVVISPISIKITSNKLNETATLISDEEEDAKAAEHTKISTTPSKTTHQPSETIDKLEVVDAIVVTTLKNPIDEVKMSPKSSPKRNRFNPASPVRRSPRLHSETGSDGSDSPTRKIDIINLVTSSSSSPIIGGRVSINSSNKSMSKDSTALMETEAVESNKKALSLDDSKEVVDGADGSFHLSLKSSIISSQDESLDKSATVRKDDNLNVSNESDKENTAALKVSPIKRVSNVFKSKNIEESYFEAMDVEYPTDNDESLSVANKKRPSLTKSAVQLVDNAIISDESTSGSLHLVCSDDSYDKKSEGTSTTENIIDSRRSVALIQLDASPITNSSTKSDVLDEPKKTFILDSRISILPAKILVPLNTNAENEKVGLENTLELNKCKTNTIYEDTHRPTEPEDTGAYVFSDDESPAGDLLVEQKDDTIEKKLADDSMKKTFPNRRDSIYRSEDTSKIEEIVHDSTIFDSSDDEVEQRAKLIDSEDSSDIDYRPNVDQKVKEVPEEYDSHHSYTSDTSSETENKTASANVQLQSITIRSSQSLDGSNDAEEASTKNSATHKRIKNLQSIPIQSTESPKSKKMKEMQHITIKSSSSSSGGSDAETMLDKLILDKTVAFNDDTDSSDSEFGPNKFLDDEAEEVSEEDTPSENSNEIIDVGDNIEFTDDDVEDEEYASGSDIDFINDDDVVELLSGNENDLDYDGKEMVKKRRKRRIMIRPVDENEEEEVAINQNQIVESTNENLSPTLTKSISDTTKVESTNDSLNKSSGSPNKRSSSKRKSSISVSENIKKAEVDNTAIAGKITNIVDLFTSSLNDSKGGNIKLNVSIDYDESSSNDEQPADEKRKSAAKMNTSDVKKLAQKRKSIEPRACDSSTVDSKVSKIKILQDVRICGDIEQAEFTTEFPPSAKISKKMKKQHNVSMDDDVFLPNLPSPNKSVKIKKTPKPSTVNPLPDNVIKLLEATTSMTDDKKPKKQGKFEVQKEFEKFSQPSTSATDNNWTVSNLTKIKKPSKNNIKKDSFELIDKKDFKSLMIAKNVLKPKQPKNSFKHALKMKKKF